MLGPLISAGASLLGGLLGRESQEDQRAKNEALQREFAQNSVQWRVNDAKKAGIHPLYAMGAPTMSPSVGVQGDPLAASLGSMGQDIGRAVAATQSGPSIDNAFQIASQELQLQNYTLRNDLLAAQIAKLKQPGSPPATGASPPVGTATAVPNDPKIEPNSRLIMGGEEVIPHPGWSPTQKVADMYGDENPAVSWIYGPLKMYMDWRHTTMAERSVNRLNIQSERAHRYGGRPAGR